MQLNQSHVHISRKICLFAEVPFLKTHAELEVETYEFLTSTVNWGKWLDSRSVRFSPIINYIGG
jgi:hypothetical protein